MQQKQQSIKAATSAANRGLRAAQSSNQATKATQSAKITQGGLSRPAVEYALALGNPFDGPLATIPDFPSVPSRRMRCYSRGTFSTGGGGYGFIMVDPYVFSTNNGSAVIKTDSTYTDTNGLMSNTGTGINAASSNSDYAGASLAVSPTNIKGRIVAFGLRIRYASTELNRGGIVLGIQTPNHTTLTGLNFAGIDSYECSGRFRPGQSWITTLYCPAYQEELVYSSNLGSQSSADFTVGYVRQPILGFNVSSPSAATSLNFEYEAFGIYEFQGRDVRGMLPSLADPAGFAAVQTTAQSTMMRPHQGTSVSNAQKLVTAAHSVAHQTLTGYLGKAVDSGIKWIEREGATVLGGLLTIL